MAFPEAYDFFNHQARWNGFIQIHLKIMGLQAFVWAG